MTARIFKVATKHEPKIGEALHIDGWVFTVTKRLGWQEIDVDMPSYVYFDSPTLEGQRRFITQCDQARAV